MRETTHSRVRFPAAIAFGAPSMSRVARAACLLLAVLVPPPAQSAPEESLPWQEARRFVEALETIRRQYVEPVDDTTLLDEAIRGMAAGLDPYSVYLDPDEYEQARIEALGRYDGIGIEVARRPEGGYVIVAPVDGGPAERAGVLSGDYLLRANGEPLDGSDPAELDRLLQGDIGSAVRLTLQRGNAPPFDVTVVRQLISIPSVSGETLPGGARYLRIAQFSDGSARDLAELLDELDAPGATAPGLVIDLRDNAGGVVDGAVEVADMFLDQGIIVSTRGRGAGQTFDYLARPGGVATDVPLVVLINNGTASAAEILAGALQDHGRATLLGENTFGKGVVQSLIPLEGGGALKLTTAHYRTPSGHLIQEAGIEPDVRFDAGAPEAASPADDPLVQRAVEFFNRTPQVGGSQP